MEDIKREWSICSQLKILEKQNKTLLHLTHTNPKNRDTALWMLAQCIRSSSMTTPLGQRPCALIYFGQINQPQEHACRIVGAP